jgi:hypothetical protein
MESFPAPHQLGEGFLAHYVECEMCPMCRQLKASLERQGYDPQEYKEQMKEMIGVSNG